MEKQLFPSPTLLTTQTNHSTYVFVSCQATHQVGQPVLVVFSCGLFGFFAFALMPVCLEVGVECTYPVAEATSAGLQWMAGYAVVDYVFIL